MKKYYIVVLLMTLTISIVSLYKIEVLKNEKIDLEVFIDGLEDEITMSVESNMQLSNSLIEKDELIQDYKDKVNILQTLIKDSKYPMAINYGLMDTSEELFFFIPEIAKMHLLPFDNSQYLTIEKNSLVQVLDKAAVMVDSENDRFWYYVESKNFSDGLNERGWVRAESVVEYSYENQHLVTKPLKLKANSKVYEYSNSNDIDLSLFTIQDEQDVGIKYIHNEYALIYINGGISYWTHISNIVYPNY